MKNWFIPLVLFITAIGIIACNKKKEDLSKRIITNADFEKTDSTFYPLITDSIGLEKFLSEFSLFSFHRNEIFQFYRNRNYQLAWSGKDGLVEQAGYFMNLLLHFDEEGIQDSVIYLSFSDALYQTVSNPDYYFHGGDAITTQLDLFLTSTFFVYAQKVWGGMSEKQTKDLNWYIKRTTIPYVSILDSILTGKRASFTAYEPVYHQYAMLKKYLKPYKVIAQKNIIWDSLYLPNDVKFFKEGDSSDLIKEIKNRLYILGDLAFNDSSIYFDEQTVTAVKSFQARYGLSTDGSAGKYFLDAINTSPQELVKKIEINMERCRWVPYDLHGDYITVNIPAYKMYIYHADTLDWEMSVIVGKSSTSTVIFNDDLEYIIFSPYWEVPPSIIANEILPAVKNNMNYFSKNHMEVTNSSGSVIDPNTISWSKYSGFNFPYRIRQTPGAHNSLGWVKFIFPNSYGIYFHDTPSRNLFSASQRSFSHGCIRIGEPQKFAEYLLREDTITWSKHRIDSVMHSGKPTKILLKNKIPVFIAYFTAWVDDNGNINFRKDIYGHDAKLDVTLHQKAGI